MLNIPEIIKQLFERDDIRKNFRVIFPNGEFADITNADIVSESVEFTESLCSQNNFRFGLTEASVLKFETVGVGNMMGMQIEASIEIDTSTLTTAQIAAIQAGSYDGVLVLAAASDIGFGFYRVPYGRFYVESCPRNHQAMAHRQVTAYSVVQVEPITFAEAMPADNLTIDLATLKEYLNPRGTWTRVNKQQNNKQIMNAFAFTDTEQYCFSNIIAEAFAEFEVYNVGPRTGEALKKDLIFKIEFETVPAIDNHLQDFAKALTEILPDVEVNAVVGGGTEREKTTLRKATVRNAGFFTNTIASSYNSRVVGEYTAKPLLATKPGVYIVPANSQVTMYKNEAIPVEEIGRYTDCWILASIAGKNNFGCRVIKRNRSTSAVIEEYLPNEWPIENKTSRPTANTKVYYKEITPEGILLKFPNSGSTPLANFGDFYDFRSQDNEGIYGGQLEIAGKFGKVSRATGEFEEVELDNTAPTIITPGMYSELWWDDYDISKIGEVLFRTKDTDETQVTVSDGQSLYDMTDNAFNAIVTGPESAINLAAKIQAEFPDATRNCYFTPAELTMIGAPWIEAGDALSITANDGTVVNTFALRHTLHGVQHITSEIEAASGNIIGLGG